MRVLHGMGNGFMSVIWARSVVHMSAVLPVDMALSTACPAGPTSSRVGASRML